MGSSWAWGFRVYLGSAWNFAPMLGPLGVFHVQCRCSDVQRQRTGRRIGWYPWGLDSFGQVERYSCALRDSLRMSKNMPSSLKCIIHTLAKTNLPIVYIYKADGTTHEKRTIHEPQRNSNMFGNVFSPKGWPKNLLKYCESQSACILSATQWFSPFQHASSMQTLPKMLLNTSPSSFEGSVVSNPRAIRKINKDIAEGRFYTCIIYYES